MPATFTSTGLPPLPVKCHVIRDTSPGGAGVVAVIAVLETLHAFGYVFFSVWLEIHADLRAQLEFFEIIEVATSGIFRPASDL